jgi:homoserine O-succinyltransferase/O-acetyltransferase
MALLIDGSQIPPRWVEKCPHSLMSIDPLGPGPECVKIALINNMPDAALEDTEMQFMELLDDASGDIPVRLKLFSLPRIPRGERGLQHLDRFYFGINDLWNSRFDAVIVTGTEPRQPDLRQEPYWSVLADLLDWAERHTASTILSCLAAHAGVLHSDGIRRHPLGDKRFGVFESARISDHELTAYSARTMRFPHSRWNEVKEEALTACGYSILTKSAEAGVDLFVKQRKKSLFVNFQGHPEYGSRTLLKEYRRDIKRFLRQERETYPTMPHGYFDTGATRLLNQFQETACAHPREEEMVYFPEAVVSAALANTWRSSAICIYRNWLQFVLSKKAEITPFAAMTTPYAEAQRKRTAVS